MWKKNADMLAAVIAKRMLAAGAVPDVVWPQTDVTRTRHQRWRDGAVYVCIEIVGTGDRAVATAKTPGSLHGTLARVLSVPADAEAFADDVHSAATSLRYVCQSWSNDPDNAGDSTPFSTSLCVARDDAFTEFMHGSCSSPCERGASFIGDVGGVALSVAYRSDGECRARDGLVNGRETFRGVCPRATLAPGREVVSRRSMNASSVSQWWMTVHEIGDNDGETPAGWFDDAGYVDDDAVVARTLLALLEGFETDDSLNVTLRSLGDDSLAVFETDDGRIELRVDDHPTVYATVSSLSEGVTVDYFTLSGVDAVSDDDRDDDCDDELYASQLAGALESGVRRACGVLSAVDGAEGVLTAVMRVRSDGYVQTSYHAPAAVDGDDGRWRGQLRDLLDGSRSDERCDELLAVLRAESPDDFEMRVPNECMRYVAKTSALERSHQSWWAGSRIGDIAYEIVSEERDALDKPWTARNVTAVTVLDTLL